MQLLQDQQRKTKNFFGEINVIEILFVLKCTELGNRDETARGLNSADEYFP